MMSAWDAGSAGVFAAHQIAVGDDGGEERLGDDVDGCPVGRRRVRATYSSCGLKATASEAGRVQGVVVQMMV